MDETPKANPAPTPAAEPKRIPQVVSEPTLVVLEHSCNGCGRKEKIPVTLMGVLLLAPPPQKESKLVTPDTMTPGDVERLRTFKPKLAP